MEVYSIGHTPLSLGHNVFSTDYSPYYASISGAVSGGTININSAFDIITTIYNSGFTNYFWTYVTCSTDSTYKVSGTTSLINHNSSNTSTANGTITVSGYTTITVKLYNFNNLIESKDFNFYVNNVVVDTTFKMTVNQDGTFFIPRGFFGLTTDFVIDWGDGSATENITTSDDELAHSYSIFPCQILITGTCPSIYFNDSRPAKSPNILSIDNWGDVGLQHFNISPCDGLLTIPDNLTGLDSMQEFTQTFNSCGSLTGTVPEFWVTFSALDGSGCFNGGSSITNYNDIPAAWGGGGP